MCGCVPVGRREKTRREGDRTDGVTGGRRDETRKGKKRKREGGRA